MDNSGAVVDRVSVKMTHSQPDASHRLDFFDLAQRKVKPLDCLCVFVLAWAMLCSTAFTAGMFEILCWSFSWRVFFAVVC